MPGNEIPTQGSGGALSHPLDDAIPMSVDTLDNFFNLRIGQIFTCFYRNSLSLKQSMGMSTEILTELRRVVAASSIRFVIRLFVRG